MFESGMIYDEFELFIEDKKDTNHIEPHVHFFKFLNRRVRLNPKTNWVVGVKMLQIQGHFYGFNTGGIYMPNLIEDPYLLDVFPLTPQDKSCLFQPEQIKFFPVQSPYFSKLEVIIKNQVTKETLSSKEVNSLRHTILILKFKPMKQREYIYHFSSINDVYWGNKPNHFRDVMGQELDFHQRQSWRMALMAIKLPSAPLPSTQDPINAFKLSVYKVSKEENYEDALETLEEEEETDDNFINQVLQNQIGEKGSSIGTYDYDPTDFLDKPLKEWTFNLLYTYTEEQVVFYLNNLLAEIKDGDDLYAKFFLTSNKRFSFESKGLLIHINASLGLCLGLEGGGLLINTAPKTLSSQETTNEFPKAMDLKKIQPAAILVKCHAVRDAEGGDKLALVPFPNSSSLLHEVRHLNYVDIDVNKLGHIEFTLTNAEEEPIEFSGNQPCIITVKIKQFQ